MLDPINDPVARIRLACGDTEQPLFYLRFMESSSIDIREKGALSRVLFFWYIGSDCRGITDSGGSVPLTHCRETTYTPMMHNSTFRGEMSCSGVQNSATSAGRK